MLRPLIALLLVAGAVLATLPTATDDGAHAMQVDPGMIAVADTGNSRIQMFYPNGTFAFAFGSHGFSGGQFTGPSAVAVGPDGRIVVVDSGNDRRPVDPTVRIFHPNGTLAPSLGNLGFSPGRGPSAVAVGPDGRIVAADPDNVRIYVFRPDGTFESAFGTSGACYGCMLGVSAVAVGPDGRIVAADPGKNRVHVFSANGTFELELGPSGDGEYLTALQAVAVGPGGRIAVVDDRMHRVHVFRPDGTFEFAFGLAGRVQTWLSSASAVAVGPDGRIAVADAGTHRVHVFRPDGSFEFELGPRGDAGGRFRSLDDVAVGPGGRIAVADYGNRSAQVFRPNGTFDFELGPHGPGSGRFDGPFAVAVGPGGRIAVADYDNYSRTAAVHVFRPDGSFEFELGPRGDAAGRFGYYLNDIAVGPGGRVVVVENGGDPDSIHDRVHVFHSDGTFDFELGPHGPGSGRFDGPFAVAVGPGGRIAVAHYSNDDYSNGFYAYTHTVSTFLPDGTFEFELGPSGDGNGRFDSIIDIAVGPGGRIAVVELGRDRIRLFHPNGTFASSFGPEGARPEKFHGPSDVAVAPDGRIVVVDDELHRVHVFRPSGIHEFAFGSEGRVVNGISSVSDVAVAPDGRIVVADSDSHHLGTPPIQVFRPNGTFAYAFGSRGDAVGQIAGGFAVAVSPGGRIVVADFWNDRVPVFHPNGTLEFELEPSGDGGGRFDYLSDIAVGPGGQIVVIGDNYDGVVQVFHPNGTFASAFGSYDEGPVQFGSLNGVAVGPGGRIAVADFGNRTVHIFRPNGTLELEFGAEWLVGDQPRPVGPHDIAVASDGRIFVAGGYSPGLFSPESLNHTVRIFHPNGTLDFEFELYGHVDGAFYGLSAVAVGPGGRIAVAELWTDRIHLFHPNGTFDRLAGWEGVGPGKFNRPSSVAVSPAPSPVADLPPPAPVVVVEPGGPGGLHNFTDAGDAANLTIDLARLTGPGGPPLDGSASSTVSFPPTETYVAASFAAVTFPPGATAAHVPAGGLLFLHVSPDIPDDALVQGALSYDGSGRVALQRIVEVGSSSGRIEFDMPVRILLEGQAGGRAFYIDGTAGGGTITPIDRACAADDAARVHRHLGGAGECHIDSAGGGKIVYTYHLTQFGTAMPERAAPPPAVHTCSVSLGMPSLGVSAEPGRHSAPAPQTVINSGSAPFTRVDLAATPWGAGLPASATEVSKEGPDDGYGAVAAQGTAVAHGLGGGQEAPLWFRLNLVPHGGLQGGTLVQNVTYNAQCGTP